MTSRDIRQYSHPMGAALLLACLALWSPAAAASPVEIADTAVFPESLTSTAGGDLIVGSAFKGAIYRARKGDRQATLWIDPKVSGMVSVLGVLADDKSGRLYACSTAMGAPPASADRLSALRSFDLQTGAPKGDYPLPGGAAGRCNDIAAASDGTVYLTDISQGRILRKASGSDSVDVWLSDPRLAGVDGIAVEGRGTIYVNTVGSGRLFRIGVDAGGGPRPLVELAPSLPLGRPDGLRLLGPHRLLLAESAAGRVSEVTVKGDRAILKPLRTGEPGLVAATKAKGQVWAIDAKFRFRSDPALKGQSAEPFLIQPIP